MTYQKLKKIVEAQGFKFFDKGDYNLNLIFVRSSDRFTDVYDDTLFIAYRVNNKEVVTELNCSTDAGIYYFSINPFKFNPKGVAIIQMGQQVLGSHRYTTRKFLGQPFLEQIVPMKYWRDKNKDTVIDKSVEEISIASTQVHNGGSILARIYNWSAGCSILPKEQYPIFLSIIDKARAIHGDIFSTTWLDKKVTL